MPKQKNNRIPALILALVQTLCLLLYPFCAQRLLDVGARRSGFTSMVPEPLRSRWKGAQSRCFLSLQYRRSRRKGQAPA